MCPLNGIDGSMKKIMVIFGTRPEAIKLAPVIVEMRRHASICSRVCVTAQHRQMLDHVLRLFDIVPDIDLDLMQPDQTLAQLTAGVVLNVDLVLQRENPDMVLVQGDTTTVMAAAMAAFYRRIRVGHVEAGLRSGNLYSPFPEEMNRKVAGIIGNLHFAPTETAAKTLLREGVPAEGVFLTGNPVIDALHMVVGGPLPRIAGDLLLKAGVNGGSSDLKLILVTAHRRENFGERFESICQGLKTLVERNRDTVIIYPVHLNPNVQEPVYRILGDTERIVLTDPVEYDVLAHLMKASYLVLTDSGGIQEEAPALGKPVLVMRTETERPEGVEAGTAKLVGPFAETIVAETEILLRNEPAYRQMARAVNPYGDGHAAERIVEVLLAQGK
jgi:UDP-N-acetylglucosamine 2-epimerase (non-hydrolysing)